MEEAKKVMEAQMLEEIERRKQEQIEEAKRREVGTEIYPYSLDLLFVLTAHSQFVTLHKWLQP